MSMDPWLAQVYGTNGGDAEDLQKLAQAEMAQQLAAQEGIDLSQLSPEQIAQLGQEMGVEGQQPQGAEGEITEEHYAQAQQILSAPDQYDPALVEQAQGIMAQVEQMQAQQGGQQQMGQPQQPGMGAPGQQQMGGQPQQPQQPGQAEQVKIAEAQAKFEEADFLGRVMAHSFNQEAEKIAAAKLAGDAALEERQRIARGHARLGGGAGALIGGAAGAMHGGGSPAARVAKGVGGAVAGGLYGAGSGWASSRIHSGVGHHLGGHMGKGEEHTKEATVNAIEKAAMAQAANILQSNGIDPATGQPLQQQAAPAPSSLAGGVPQQQTSQQALGDLVEKRAHQILRGLGYNI